MIMNKEPFFNRSAEPVLGPNKTPLIWIAVALILPLLWFEITDPRGLLAQYNHRAGQTAERGPAKAP